MTDNSLAPPPAGDRQVDWRAAFRFGWSRFKDNAKAWVICTLPFAVGIILLVPGIIHSREEYAGSISVALVALGVVAFWWTISAGPLAQGALHEVDGRTPAMRDFVKNPNYSARLTPMLLAIIAWLPVFVGGGVTEAVRGILALVAILLTFIAEIALLLLSFFAQTFALDQRQSPFAAIGSSVRLARTNFRQLAPFALVCTGVVIAGALLCCVGILVAIPVVVIASTYVYRTLVHGTVVELDGTADRSVG